MSNNSIAVLKELYDDIVSAKAELQDMLQNNLNRLEEISVFFDTIEKGQSFDSKFFSPRNAENLNRDKVAACQAKREHLLQKNDDYRKRIEKYDRQLNEITKVMKSVSEDGKYQCKKLTVLDIQEKERTRIARELHDSSLQNLTHIIHEIELSSKFIDQDSIRAKLELASCSQNLKRTINEIRDTIFNLRPMSFDDLGFKKCVENFVDVCLGQFRGVQMECDVDEIKAADLYLVTVYRIMNEAVMNSLKHSKGDKISLSVKEKENNLVIKISDNGKGFSVDKVLKEIDNREKHFGLSIMKERVYLLNGTIKMDSQPDDGTRIEILIPKPAETEGGQ